MINLLNLGFVVLFAVLGYLIGGYLERRHFRSIRDREAKYQGILTFNNRQLPEALAVSASGSEAGTNSCDFVSGNVVISIDYFKRLAAGLRGLIGGRVGAYETLVDRARREALLRMKEDAMAKNLNMVFGVRLETSSIAKGSSGQLGMVEVFAYGTGVSVNSA